MPTIKPVDRPKLSRSDVEKVLTALNVSLPAIVAVRGYYLDSMGAKGANDRDIYDDAIAVIDAGAFSTFNGNTDPSVALDGVAILRPGVWRYQKGRHPLVGGYPALRQAAPVEVDRFGRTKVYRGLFGINVHKGSLGTTSSRGCQTIYPSQWVAFKTLVYALMDRNGAVTIPYVLVTEERRRQLQ